MSNLQAKSFFPCLQDRSKEMLEALQCLYENEINFSIVSFWDAGFDAKLGNEISGFKAEGSFDTFNECIYFLVDKAIEFYPNSKFAEVYKD